MTGPRYPRFVMEGDRCVLKLWNPDGKLDEEVAEIDAGRALVLLRDLAAIVGRLVNGQAKS